MQKYFYLPSIVWLYCLSLCAQKEDNVWLFGGNFDSSDSINKACRVDFGADTPTITFINKDLPYYGTNVSISDSNGLLHCFSNGKHLFNKEYSILDSGANFYPTAVFQGGVNYIQGYSLIPHPNGNNKVIYIYGLPKLLEAPVPGGYTIGYTQLKNAIVDMSLNGGLGKVIQRDIVFSTDTLMPTQFNAIRHGNGRDWWLLAPYFLGNRFHRFLLDPEGLHQAGAQDIQATDLGLGHTCF